MKRLALTLCVTTMLTASAFAQSGEMIERGLTPGAGLMDMSDPANPVPITLPASKPAAAQPGAITATTTVSAPTAKAPALNAAPVATTEQVNAIFPPRLPAGLTPRVSAPPMQLNDKRMVEQALPSYQKIPPVPAHVDKAALAQSLGYQLYIIREWNDHYDRQFFKLYNAKLAELEPQGQKKCMELIGGLWRDMYVGSRRWSEWKPEILAYIADHNTDAQLHTATEALKHFYTGEGFVIIRDAIANVKIDPLVKEPNYSKILDAAVNSVNERNPGCAIKNPA